MNHRYRAIATALLAQYALAAGAAVAEPLQIYTELSPPASMREGGVVTGRETEKIRAAMARTGTSYRIDMLPWKRAYTVALSQANTCLYSTSRTPEREHLFKWVGPTDEAEWVFFGRPDHTFTLRTLEDARTLRIGTYNGDAREEFLRSRGFRVDSVNDDAVNPQKLMMDRIDLWAVGMRNGSQAVHQRAWADKLVPLLVFNRVQVYLACNPSVPDRLIERLNAALAEMRRDGTMDKVERKYEHWVAPKPK